MVQFDNMQAFVRVVDAGGITAAADQLNLAKSVVSRRLAQLESELGVQLISRTTRRQQLTEAGQRYYQHCVRILDDIKEARADVNQSQQALSGSINLAVPSSFGLNHLQSLLTDFAGQHPEVRLNIDFNDRRVNLLEEGFDLAVRIAAHLDDNRLVAKKVGTSHMILCAGLDYLKQHGRPQKPQDLTHNHVKIHYRQNRESWLFFDQNKEISITIPSIMTANNGEFIKQAAIDNQGLALIPDFIAHQSIEQGQLVSLLADFLQQQTLNIYLVHLSKRFMPQRIKLLMNTLSEYLSRCEWHIK